MNSVNWYRKYFIPKPICKHKELTKVERLDLDFQVQSTLFQCVECGKIIHRL